jgi:hypothetical protein
MGKMRSIGCGVLGAILLGLIGCSRPKPYGYEPTLLLPGTVRQVWAVAPVINLSGQKAVDPILQADLLYGQLQQIAGLTVLPVNRVVEVYGALRIERVESEEQAALVCDLLGCDALVVATVTVYDPFDPPKMGGSLQLLRRGDYRRPADVDPRELARLAAPAKRSAMPPAGRMTQAVGMFDAANGSVRSAALQYARGRNDPAGPYQDRIVLVEMDRYAGFVYHYLITDLLAKPGIGKSNE